MFILLHNPLSAQGPDAPPAVAQKENAEVAVGDAVVGETGYNVHLGPWKIMGPFSGAATQEARFKIDTLGAEGKSELPDEVTTQGKNSTWTSAPPGPINFGILFEPGTEFMNSVAYAATTIRSSEEKEAKLAVNADDGVRGWLNGEKVIDSVRPNGVALDDTVYPVKLRKGDNLLLLKVDTIGGDWGAMARLLPPET